MSENISTSSYARPSKMLGIALAGLLLAAGVVSATPLAASAHNELIDTTPAAGSESETAPETITMTFSGGINVAEVFVVSNQCLPTGVIPDSQPQTFEGTTPLNDAALACESYTDGAPVIDANTVTQTLRADEIPTGAVTVLAQVVYDDTHPGSWTYGFSVEQGADTPDATSTPTESATPEQSASASPSASAAPTTDVSPQPSATDGEQTAAGDDNSWIIWLVAGTVVVGLLAVVTIITLSRKNKPRN